MSCFFEPPEEGQDPDEIWCPEHAHAAGFCWCCGLFWAGIESFDFDPQGLCPNCRDEFDHFFEEAGAGYDDHYGEDVDGVGVGDDSEIWIGSETEIA